ncbi:MAG: four helix bundle protein [Deltaproteobacteria bacterium]|nr:MAG: four helix bundle protein [Deltaproteobacteria bacterium]
MGKFQDFKVWKRGKDLAVSIYKLTGHGIFSKDYGLRDQIRRAAVSIPSNIAEGDELGKNKQAIRYFFTSKGSTAEVLTQAIIAHEIGYLDDKDFQHIQKECRGISGMLTRLIQSRSR